MKARSAPTLGQRRDVEYLVLLLTWGFFGSICGDPSTNLSLFLIWVFLTSFVSITALTAVGHFDHQIPNPEMGSIFTLVIMLPLAGFLSKWLLMLTSHVPPIRYIETLKASIGAAFAFELAELGIFKFYRRVGRKWSLAAHIAPDELDVLRAQIKASGAAEWIRIHPHHARRRRMRGDETIVISRKSLRHLKDYPDLLAAHLRGQLIVDLRELLKEFRGRISLQHSDGWTFLLGSTYQTFLLRSYFYVKEIFEVFVAIILLIVLLPFGAALSLGVLFTGGAPVLYRQKRLGYRGKEFFLYKFRSMPVTAENDGPQWASKDDPRVSRFGRWLRKSRLDELPQLLNVIKGDLSFVGPRPERPEFYTLLSTPIPLFSTRLLVRPGITGWAQVRQGYASSVEECKRKLEYDLYYVQNMSPKMDFQIMVSTIVLMFRGNSGQ